MENTYTITLYYYNRSSNGIYTKTQLLKEAGKITGRESNVVKNFSSFERDDKIIICNFIEKAQALYKYKTDEYDELFMTLRGRMRAIVSEFVRDTFHTEPSQTPGHKIMLMEKFNGLELDELKRMLLDVLDKASIKELVENGDDLNAKLARAFTRKVVAAKE